MNFLKKHLFDMSVSKVLLYYFSLWLLLALCSTSCHGQIVSVRAFPGKDLATKLASAQLLGCSPDNNVTCLLVIEPELGVFTVGSLPSRCSRCHWLDWTTQQLDGNTLGGVFATGCTGTAGNIFCNSFNSSTASPATIGVFNASLSDVALAIKAVSGADLGVMNSGSDEFLFDHPIRVGANGGTTGEMDTFTFGVLGTTSGKVSIQVPAAPTSYTLKLPSTVGTAGQPLLYGSTMTWGTLGGSTTTFPTQSGNLTNGNCIQSDVNHNLVDAGVTCGSAAVTTFVNPVGNGSNLAPFGTANVTRLYGFTLPVQSTSTTFQYHVSTADNTANLYDMGIYDSGGTLKAHLGATAGTTLFAATGSRSAAWTGGSVTLAAGKYWVGYATNCAASCAVVAGASIFTFGTQAIPSANNTTSGGALNSSVTPPADSWAVGGIPAFVLR